MSHSKDKLPKNLSIETVLLLPSPGTARLPFFHNIVFELTAAIALRLQPFDDDVLLAHSCGLRRAWLGWDC